jgi:hypothetical protein
VKKKNRGLSDSLSLIEIIGRAYPVACGRDLSFAPMAPVLDTSRFKALSLGISLNQNSIIDKSRRQQALMNKSRKSPAGKSGRKSAQLPKSKWVPVLVLVFVGAAALAYFLFFQRGPRSEQPTNAGKPPQNTDVTGLGLDPRKLIGRWTRPDGGYTIQIRDVDARGLADAGYFNPRPIHVSQAVVTRRDRGLELFIELQDAGYPGSTYTLLYDAQRDLLGGIYYQAALNQSFDVMFLRAK